MITLTCHVCDDYVTEVLDRNVDTMKLAHYKNAGHERERRAWSFSTTPSFDVGSLLPTVSAHGACSVCAGIAQWARRSHLCARRWAEQNAARIAAAERPDDHNEWNATHVAMTWRRALERAAAEHPNHSAALVAQWSVVPLPELET